jgi:hypothetical protein
MAAHRPEPAEITESAWTYHPEEAQMVVELGRVPEIRPLIAAALRLDAQHGGR